MAKTEFKFDGENFDWSSYLISRPQYPKSLYDIILAHHKEYSDKWDHVYDVGTGVGIVALELAPRFASVTASDPSVHHISQAPSFVSSQTDAKNIEFLQCGAEDTSKLAAGSIDMMTMAEAIVYADYDQTIASAKYHLSPGGTFAAWIYDIVPRIIVQPGSGPDEVQAIINQFFDTHFTTVLSKFSTKPLIHLYADLADLKFPTGDWTNVRRIHWKRNRVFGEFVTSVVDEDSPQGFVRPWEKVEEHEDSCMFLRDVDYQLLSDYLQSLTPFGKIADLCPTELAALKETMAGGRKFDLAFSTSLVLATKR